MSHTTLKTSSDSSQVLKEWTAQVSCKEFEAGGSYSVYLFLGPVPDDPTRWMFDPTFAGTFDIFTSEYAAMNRDLEQRQKQLIHGYVNLNRAIVKQAEITSFEADDVVPYLKETLHWGVQKVTQQRVPLDKVPSLEVLVLCVPLTVTPGAEYPTRGEPVPYYEITRGKPGGYNKDEPTK